MGITVDNRQAAALDLLAFYNRHGFTDGANVRKKNIRWTGSVATNAWHDRDTTQDASVNKDIMNWSQVKQLIDADWSLLDQGAFPDTRVPGAVALKFNTLMNAAANRNYTFRKLAALGVQYVLRSGATPASDPNYNSAWEQLGYIGSSSESIDNSYSKTIPDPKKFGLIEVTNWKKDNRYKVHLRGFKISQSSQSDAQNFLESTAALCNQANASVNYSLELGLPGAAMDKIRIAIDSFYSKANDKIWVCGLQEFYEYFQTMQQTAITQNLSGNVLTVTLDQRFLPEEQRWRDMSFLLSSNAIIKTVTVTGADDYSYNTKTGLINIYKKKTNGYAVPQSYRSTGFVFNKKIPLELNDLYIDNNYDSKPVELIDGNTSTQFYAKAYDHPMIYTPYEVVVDLSDYGAVVDKVRIYGNGRTATTQVILTRNDNEVETVIGTLSTTSGWQEFDVTGNKFVASRLILRSQSTSGFGNELEVYADYLPYTEQIYAHRKTPLKYMLGVNAHWWNFVRNAVGSSSAIVEEKIRAFDSLHLYSLRNYGNAKEYTTRNGAVWAFNPVIQGWFEDLFMRRLKQDNPELIRWSVLQGQFNHIRETWEIPDTTWNMKGRVTSYDDKQGWGVLTLNVFQAGGKGWWGHWYLDGLSGNSGKNTSDVWHDIPVSFPASKTFVCAAHLNYKPGDTIWVRARHVSQLNYLYANNNDAGRSRLSTWDTLARLAYHWAARKGTNPKAGKFIPYQPHFTGIDDNNDSVGLGTSEWTEIMNEPNAWWVGYDDYLNGRHLAAAWSKIYDNHKTFSTTLGAKNADPNMIVSSSGLAVSTVDLNRSADLWAKENRGNRPKTEVPTQPAFWRARTFGWSDNPYDVIQFHNYSFTGGSNQFAGGVNAGLPPELSNVLQAVDEFVWFRNKYAPWAKVDVGEWGYDVNRNSPMNAPAIGQYNAEQVRGAWAIRTLLGYNAHGVDLAQWYRLYMDYESDSSNPGQFATMSLLKENSNGTISRRVVGNYFRQLSDFGDYVFDSTLRSDSIQVLRFKKDDHWLYAIWGVEKMTTRKDQRPAFTNRTGIYNLQLPPRSRIHLKRFQDNDIEMLSANHVTKGKTYPVKYDLKPVFIVLNSKE